MRLKKDAMIGGIEHHRIRGARLHFLHYTANFIIDKCVRAEELMRLDWRLLAMQGAEAVGPDFLLRRLGCQRIVDVRRAWENKSAIAVGIFFRAKAGTVWLIECQDQQIILTLVFGEKIDGAVGAAMGVAHVGGPGGIVAGARFSRSHPIRR